MPPAHAAPRRRPSPGAPALRCPLGADLLLVPTPPCTRHFAGKGWVLPFFFFYFKDWGKILGSEYTHQPIRLCSEGENKRGEGACSTQEPVNCFPVAPLSSATPASLLQASIPHLLSQSIAREPTPGERALGLLCPTGSGPKAGLAYVQLARFASRTQPSFGVRFGERLPLRMPLSPDSEP